MGKMGGIPVLALTEKDAQPARPLNVNQHAKLSSLGVETASKSFHPSVSPYGILAGGYWSVLYGHHLRNSQAA